MYAALGRVKRHRHEFDFKIVPVTDLSDASIFNRMCEDCEKGITSFALCQPPRLISRQYRLRKMFRKIPYVLRMPHWLLVSRNLIKNATDKAQKANDTTGKLLLAPPGSCFNSQGIELIVGNKPAVLSYPPDSTSGDYVLQHLIPLLREMKLVPEHKPTLKPQVTGVSLTEPASELEATFEPWHYENDDVASVMELAGPMFDITALILPYYFGIPFESDGEGPRINAEPRRRSAARNVSDELYRTIIRHLSDTINELLETQGDLTRINKLLADWQNQVIDVYPNAYPDFAKENDQRDVFHRKIASFLSVYVTRSCFYPFRAVLSSIGVEVEGVVERSLRKGLITAKREFEHTLNLYLGENRRWATLTFKERLCVNRDWVSGEKKQFNDLAIAIAHYRGLSERFEEYLAKIKVRINQGSQRFSLVQLRNEKEDKFRCNQGEPGSTQHQKCEARNIETKPMHCFQCIVGGRIHTIVDKARYMLQMHLHERYPDIMGDVGVVCNDYEDEFTLFHWHDFYKFFRTFKDELRRPDTTSEEAPIKIVVKSDRRDNCSLRSVFLVAIFWRGETKPGSSRGNGNGNAVKILSAWSESHKVRGQEPFVGMWFRDKNPEFTFISPSDASQGNSSKLGGPQNEKLWEDALCEAENYLFAYVAIFDTSSIELYGENR